jgi:hypothetical protein
MFQTSSVDSPDHFCAFSHLCGPRHPFAAVPPRAAATAAVLAGSVVRRPRRPVSPRVGGAELFCDRHRRRLPLGAFERTPSFWRRWDWTARPLRDLSRRWSRTLLASQPHHDNSGSGPCGMTSSGGSVASGPSSLRQMPIDKAGAQPTIGPRYCGVGSDAP